MGASNLTDILIGATNQPKMKWRPHTEERASNLNLETQTAKSFWILCHREAMAIETGTTMNQGIKCSSMVNSAFEPNNIPNGFKNITNSSI